MFIPLGTERPRRRPTLVTYALMALCVGVFMLQSASDARRSPDSPPAYERFILYALDAEEATAAATSSAREPGGGPVRIDLVQSRWYQFVTYQFLHGGWLHLLGNMLFLFVFGPPVEDRLGRVGFAAFYLAGGVVAGLIHGALETTTIGGVGVSVSVIPPVVGASGSIAAVSGAFLVLFPLVRIKLLVFLVIIGVFAIPAWWFIAVAIARDLVFQGFANDNVARVAHLGGYAFGAAVPIALLWSKLLSREPYDLFSIGRQANRRRQFRELMHRQAKRESSPWAGEAPSMRRRSPERRPGGSGDEVGDPALSGLRGDVGAKLAAGDASGAADAYLGLVSRSAEAALPRDQQLRVSNALFERGSYADAAAAYERFLARYRSDREADDVRLLLALVNARHLNDPVRAGALLAEVDRARLSGSHAALLDTIRSEIA